MSNWNYNGDVNVEHGGYWWRQERPDDDYAEVVDVIPESDMGGPDNVFIITAGVVYLGNENALESALKYYGYNGDTPSLSEKVGAMMSYAGMDTDYTDVIRIGEPDPYARDSNYEPEQIHGNWKMKNYIKRNYL